MFGERNNSVGVIGLGIIGSRIAEVLRKAGRHVYVWNRSPKAQPNFLASPAEMASLTDTIQIFVTDGEAVLEVVQTMLPELTPDHTVLNHSTISLADTQRAHDILGKTGATFIDAPFTGSKNAAEAGELCYYVSGEPGAFEAATAILEPSAKQILDCGPLGQATVVKIATNMISATTVQVLSEALALVRAQGISPAVFEEALSVNACRSTLTDMKVPTVLAGDFQPHFSLKNMFKDAQLALDLASEQDIELPALSSTAAAMLEAMGRGQGDEDFSILSQGIRPGDTPPEGTTDSHDTDDDGVRTPTAP